MDCRHSLGAMWLVIFRHSLELNIQIDQHAEVFLNMLEYKAGELEREPCAKDWQLVSTCCGLLE